MSDRIMNWPVKWVGVLAHVREVTLLGTADLSFWRDWLAELNLRPTQLERKAQLMIVGAESKYMGICFRELSFSVLVSTQELGAQQDAVYLVRAFNSSRLLTICEQVFFSTPYCHGDVRMSARWPVAVCVAKNGDVRFGAQMQMDASGLERQTSHHGEDGWEGPIFLPRTSRKKGRKDKLFFARLRGDTKRYPFLLSKDSMTINPSPDFDILQALTESHFVANEWVVREDATHARSKTYRTANVLPDMTLDRLCSPLLRREFTVELPIEQAWRHLARVEQWPSWAKHIKQVEVQPPGELGPESTGHLLLTNGLRPAFRMTEFNPYRSWKWVGRFLWLTIYYDHRFEELNPTQTKLTFELEGKGFGVSVLGRLFAKIYSKSLDRAIPLLVQEMNASRV